MNSKQKASPTHGSVGMNIQPCGCVVTTSYGRTHTQLCADCLDAAIQRRDQSEGKKALEEWLR